MRKLKLNKYHFIIYPLIFVLFLILANAKVYALSPFGFGCYVALVWCGAGLMVTSCEYLVANVLDFSWANLYSAVCTVFVIVLAYLIHKKIKKPMNVWLVGLYGLISQLVSAYYVFEMGGLMEVLCFVGLGILFLYACVTIFQVVALRGLWSKTTLDENICLAIFFVAIAYGLAPISIFKTDLYKYVGVFLILFLVGINKKPASVVIATAIGLGVSIMQKDLRYIGELVIIAVSANVYSCPHKYKFCLTALLGDIVLQAYFGGLHARLVYQLLPTLVAILIFLCIPNKLLERIVDKYQICEAELSVRNVINSTRKNLKYKMSELADVFQQMQQIYFQLVKNGLSEEQMIGLISGELNKGFCSECKHKNACYKGLGFDGVACVNKLVETGLKKGKVSILDLPTAISQKCGATSLLINRINQQVDECKKYSAMLKDVNNVKSLLGEQMGSISQLLLDLGEELDKNITFENSKQEEICSKLLAHNIICNEILIFAEKFNDLSVVLIVKGNNAYNPIVAQVVGKTMKLEMEVYAVEPTNISGFFSVKLRRKCKRDIVFGISSRTKTGSTSSGDSHTLIWLGNDRYLLALCDGMGSGEKAERMSALTIGLIENFYKAGFDDEYIISNVNKLLAINNREEFATLDLCVVDLNRELFNFIKIGAPYSVVKREFEVEKVENGTLPLGILKQVTPATSSYGVSAKDMIVMITDGISDAFGDYDSLATFVNQIASSNPQTVSQTILDEAILRNGNTAKDDMTVLVARTYLKG